MYIHRSRDNYFKQQAAIDSAAREPSLSAYITNRGINQPVQIVLSPLLIYNAPVISPYKFTPGFRACCSRIFHGLYAKPISGQLISSIEGPRAKLIERNNEFEHLLGDRGLYIVQIYSDYSRSVKICTCAFN